MSAKAKKVWCPYCKAQAELTTTLELYGKAYGAIYICRPCQAWVGCHKGTLNPLGNLADAELRLLRKQAHEAFDPVWRSWVKRIKGNRYKARTAGYRWLAKNLGIPEEECHIGMFDKDMCERVIELCEKGDTNYGKR